MLYVRRSSLRPLRFYLRAKDLGCRKYPGEQVKTLLTSTLPTGRKTSCQASTPSRNPSKKSVSCSARPLNTVPRPGLLLQLLRYATFSIDISLGLSSHERIRL